MSERDNKKNKIRKLMADLGVNSEMKILNPLNIRKKRNIDSLLNKKAVNNQAKKIHSICQYKNCI